MPPERAPTVRKLALAALLLAMQAVFVMAAHAGDGQHLVRVSMADGRSVEPALYDTLRELGARVGVGVVEASTPAANAWSLVELAATSDGAVDITVASRGQPTAHRHVAPAASDAMRREIIAHVLLGIVEGNLEADRSRAPPAPTPLAAEAPPPALAASEDEHALQLQLAGALGAAWLARDEPAARLESSLGLVSPRRFEPGIALALGASLRPVYSVRQRQARLSLASVRVRPSLIALRRARFALELALPLGVDLAFVKLSVPVRGDDDMPPERASRSSVTVQPVIGPALAGRLRVARALELTLCAGVDIDLAPRDWTARDGPSELTLAALDRVRPYLTVGVAWSRPGSQTAR